MSAKNCVVVVFPTSAEPYVVRDPKDPTGYFSKKDAQRQATAHVQNGGIEKAVVVEEVMVVNA